VSGRELLVRVADLGIGEGEDTLITMGLGSCVAILLHDAEAQIGGLAHVLLPSPALARDDGKPARFPQTAVPRLLQMMTAKGAQLRRITARLAGGASMFAALAPPGTVQMGERNLLASRQALLSHNVPLVGEAVGGDFGRTVRLRVKDGVVQVSTVAHGTQQL
jgi:chemotaxis protein CheD